MTEDDASGKWFIRREINTGAKQVVITIKGEPMPRMGCWGVTVKVNGELVENRQTDDFLGEAEKIIDAEILNNVDYVEDVAEEIREVV